TKLKRASTAVLSSATPSDQAPAPIPSSVLPVNCTQKGISSSSPTRPDSKASSTSGPPASELLVTKSRNRPVVGGAPPLQTGVPSHGNPDPPPGTIPQSGKGAGTSKPPRKKYFMRPTTSERLSFPFPSASAAAMHSGPGPARPSQS